MLAKGSSPGQGDLKIVFHGIEDVQSLGVDTGAVGSQGEAIA